MVEENQDVAEALYYLESELFNCEPNLILANDIKEKWTYTRKNMLVCAWHVKVKIAALTCFKD